MDVEAAVSSALEARAAGRWADVRRELEALPGWEADPALLKALGDAYWWLGDAARSISLLEKAYSLSREAGELFDATETALWVAALYDKSLGNRAACRGWIDTAERLIEAGGLEPMRGWLLWSKADVASSPEEARDLAQEAVDLARQGGDRDLELAAMGELGKCYVELGRSAEGLRLIDEAMAAAMGEQARTLDTVVATCCSMMGACDQAADLERISQWCRAADRFMSTYGSPFLFADCRMRYGGVLMATGHWAEAERELRAAAAVTTPDTDYYARSMSRLALLRLQQGRLEEAETMLAPLEERHPSLLPLARLQHARGEHEVATRTCARYLEADRCEPVERAQALDLMVSCRLAAGRLDEAEEAVESLGTLAGSGVMRIAAHHLFATGRLALAAGDPSAEQALEQAMRRFSDCRLVYETACARLALAQALSAQPEVAAAEAQGAFSTFERLGAVPDADAAAALIRSLGGAARTGPKSVGVLTKREQEVLALIGLGLSNPQIAERLYLSRKTVSHHVSNILSKLGLRNRAEAAVEAARSLSPSGIG